MKNFIKMVMCLCAGIIVTNAMEPIDKQTEGPAGNSNVITFDGNDYVKGCDYIKFDVDKSFPNSNIRIITAVSINRDQLKGIEKPEEITIKIPGFVGGKHICIDKKAFKNLNSKYLKIKLQFEENTSCTDDRKRVFFADNCDQMFGNSASITEIDFSGADLSSITSAIDMFANCSNLNKITFGDCAIPELTDMSRMFLNCKSLVELDLSKFDTSKVTSMLSMFQGCEGLEKLDFSKFNTSKVTNMCHMFFHCENLRELNVSSFNTNKVSNMMNMFAFCKQLKSLNLRNFDTFNVILMQGMFSDCENLEGLELDNFRIRNNAVNYNMFSNCSKLSRICVPKTQIDVFKNLIQKETKNAMVYSPKEDNIGKVENNIDEDDIDGFEVINKPKDKPKDDDEIKDEDDF